MFERVLPANVRLAEATGCRVEGGVFEVWLNRPQVLNATTEQMVAELDAALDIIETTDVRAVVMAGVGRAFCAGRDLSGFNAASESAQGLLEDLYNPLIVRIASLDVPTIATVHGAVLGTGLGLSLACDLVIAAESTRIGSPFPRIGAVLDSGGHAFLLERVGWARANDLILTGRLVDGKEAEGMGLVSRAFADEDFENGCSSIISEIAGGPTAAFKEQKRLLRGLRSVPLDQVLAAEAKAQGRVAKTQDYSEGIEAFLQKRVPDFKGK